MNLEDLQSARNRERRTDSLQPLQNSFYDDAARFVHELRGQRDEVAAAAEDPFDSPDVRRLTNSIKTAENTVEAIYERRVGKVVKLASLDAAGMTTDDDGLTPEERDLFGTLTDAIERNRREVIEGLGTTNGEGKEAPGTETLDAGGTSGSIDSAGGVDPDGVADPADVADIAPESAVGAGEPNGTEAEPSGDTPPEASTRGTRAAGTTAEETGANDVPTPPEEGEATDAMSAADVMGAPAGSAGSASGSDSVGASTDTGPADAEAGGPERIDSATTGGIEGTDRETIRITRDVGEIVGIDERVYDLASEDVVTLPAANAKPLVDRDAAERLE